ncbi:unnamed protein product [Anisakis simplex]|uniref:Zinc finger CCCH domain-containing protein 10 n=1 Tax=Anisakis simplex TaxID=6269 RepID=A0A0M3JZJ0_ANISI|nr:unnamed protein product [Anisakis simplex]
MTDIKPDIKKENSDMKKNGAERDDVCRDFLKNICNRGSRCKFYHPEEVERERAQDSSGSKQEFNFCIDFQNRGCHRENCRFIHAHRDDVERYKSTGEVTLNLARAIAAVHTGDTINGIPFCKEFQTGICSRGSSRCRYWHVNVEEERERRRRHQRGLPLGPVHMRGAGGMPAMPPPYGYSAPYGAGGTPRRPLPYGGGSESYDAMIAAAGVKRARFEAVEAAAASQDYARELERKNAELAKENEGLKRELQRERERYEDLYALFRQRGAGGAPPTPVPGPDAVAAANSGAFGGGGGGYGAPGGGNPNGAPPYYSPSVQTNWTSAAQRSHWAQ